MARGRTIKPGFMRSHSMGRVSREARLTFIQLWLVADDEGRLVDHMFMLSNRLYPGDDEAARLLPGWLAELEREHCIERYTVERDDCLRIVNWHRHQKVAHPSKSRLPAPLARARNGELRATRESVGAVAESLGSDGEKTNGAKALSPEAPIPERFTTPRESLGRKSPSPWPARLFTGFHERFARK